MAKLMFIKPVFVSWKMKNYSNQFPEYEMDGNAKDAFDHTFLYVLDEVVSKQNMIHQVSNETFTFSCWFI